MQKENTMQKDKKALFEKKYTLKEKTVIYLKRLVIALGINCIAAGVFVIVGRFLFHTKISTEAFSNALFMVGVLYMLYCYAIFQGSINSRLDSSNLEMTSTQFDKNNTSQTVLDCFSRTEAMFISASYMIATVGLAFVFAFL